MSSEKSYKQSTGLLNLGSSMGEAADVNNPMYREISFDELRVYFPEPSPTIVPDVGVLPDGKAYAPKSKRAESYLLFNSKYSYIVYFINYYFSIENLSRDTYFVNMLTDGRVLPLDRLVTFPRLAAIGTTISEVEKAVELSDTVCVVEKDSVRGVQRKDGYAVPKKIDGHIDSQYNPQRTTVIDPQVTINRPSMSNVTPQYGSFPAHIPLSTMPTNSTINTHPYFQFANVGPDHMQNVTDMRLAGVNQAYNGTAYGRFIPTVPESQSSDGPSEMNDTTPRRSYQSISTPDLQSNYPLRSPYVVNSGNIINYPLPICPVNQFALMTHLGNYAIPAQAANSLNQYPAHFFAAQQNIPGYRPGTEFALLNAIAHRAVVPYMNSVPFSNTSIIPPNNPNLYNPSYRYTVPVRPRMSGSFQNHVSQNQDTHHHGFVPPQSNITSSYISSAPVNVPPPVQHSGMPVPVMHSPDLESTLANALGSVSLSDAGAVLQNDVSSTASISNDSMLPDSTSFQHNAHPQRTIGRVGANSQESLSSAVSDYNPNTISGGTGSEPNFVSRNLIGIRNESERVG